MITVPVFSPDRGPSRISFRSVAHLCDFHWGTGCAPFYFRGASFDKKRLDEAGAGFVFLAENINATTAVGSLTMNGNW